MKHRHILSFICTLVLFIGVFAGTTVSAADTRATGNFTAVGTDVREDNSLRVTFSVDTAFLKSLSDVEFGAIVLPTYYIYDNQNARYGELTIDGKYLVGGKTYTPAVVKADRLLKAATDKTVYSVCLTMKSKNYIRMYTARGYVKYKDGNGKEQILYTDEIAATLHAVAKTKTSAAAKAVVSTVKAEINAAQGYAVSTVCGSAADQNKYIYKNAADLAIQKIVINSGKGGEAVDVIQLSDLHFNYLNAKDYQEKNPTLMASVQNRTWLANGESVGQARKLLDYAAMADQIVVSGDTIDYLSHGAVELLHKEIWARVPDAIVTSGNHEIYQAMANDFRNTIVPMVNESLPLETRVNWLKSEWKHDYTYSSKVVNNKVMVIQMDNGQMKFVDGQAERFAADVATARQKGYTVLVFVHVPVYTNNPSERRVMAYNGNDPDRYDFYKNNSGDFVCKPTDDPNSANAKVYSVLTNNADVIKGVFTGHMHSSYYTEIVAKTADGADAKIPQYTMDRNGATHIVVK